MHTKHEKNIFIFVGELPLVKNDIDSLVERIKTEKEINEHSIITLDEDYDLKKIIKSISNRQIYGKYKLLILKNATFLEKETNTQDFNKFISLIKNLENLKTFIIIHIDRLESKLPAELTEYAEVYLFRLNNLKDKEKKNYLYSFCQKLLEKNNKKMNIDDFNYLISLVGDDLVNLQTELEKIILYTDKNIITKEDIDNIVYKSNKEPIYELTSAILEKNLVKSLQVYKNLLSQQIHPLVIAANIFNLIKRLVIIKEILTTININKHKYDDFKKNDYNKLQEIFNNYSLDLFKDMHPYALFILIKSEANFNGNTIMKIYNDLYKIDFMLKDSAINPEIAVEFLLINLCINT